MLSLPSAHNSIPVLSPPLTWTFEPSVLVGVGAISVLYIKGWQRARRPGQPHPPGYDKLALFTLSMLTVLLALVSPIDTLSTDLMCVHMVQHLMLLDIMPILLILSLTKGILRPVTRYLTTVERRVGPLAHPWFAVLMLIVAMVVWHIPACYDDATAHPMVHVLEHLCFSAVGTLYWWHLLSPIRSRAMRFGSMNVVVYISVAKACIGIIGIILTFAPHSLYPWYQHHPHYWGLSARTDQNVAGAIMALEQSVVMGLALVYLFVKMLDESDREAQKRDRYEVA
jgi:cytochrome c oxidase assembly factor CtaG